MSPRITIKRLGGGDENNSSDEQEWLDHVTEVFAFKGTPREYFQRHYYFDPYRHHPPAALLGLFADGILASSVRIYARKMNVREGMVVSVAGIGDVSTKKAYEGRGYAKQLLELALVSSSQQTALADSVVIGGTSRPPEVIIGLLHTRTAIPFYRSQGWTSLALKRCLFGFGPLEWAELLDISASPGSEVRVVDFDSPGLVSSLASLHTQTTTMLTGPLVRDSLEYWQRWMRAEATSINSRRPVALFIPNGVTNEASAYAIVNYPAVTSASPDVDDLQATIGVTVTVKEFCTSGPLAEQNQKLRSLLKVFWDLFMASSEAVRGGCAVEVRVLLPFHPSVATKLFPGKKFQECLDEGFMVKGVDRELLDVLTSSEFTFFDCDAF